MTPNDLVLLDNPIWHALQTKHRAHADGTSEIQRYPNDILPFIGFEKATDQILNGISPWIKNKEHIFIVGDLPPVLPPWKILNTLTCVQMVCSKPQVPLKLSENIINLHEADRPEMFEFINSIQPGYFKTKTPVLGNYYGIKIDGKLVAMAGERLKINGFTEVSAICTHPNFTGRGFARQLTSHVCKAIFKEGSVPFLHVVHTNTRAIKIYEQTGFIKRKEIPFWEISYSI